MPADWGRSDRMTDRNSKIDRTLMGMLCRFPSTEARSARHLQIPCKLPVDVCGVSEMYRGRMAA